MSRVENEDGWIISTHPLLDAIIEESRIYWKSLLLSIIGFVFFCNLLSAIYHGWRWNLTEADLRWQKKIEETIALSKEF